MDQACLWRRSAQSFEDASLRDAPQDEVGGLTAPPKSITAGQGPAVIQLFASA